MIRRFFIELIVLIALLLFCGIYGAVMVRDTASSVQAQAEPAASRIVIPGQQSEQAAATATTVTQSQPTDGVPLHTQQGGSRIGRAFSAQMSRFVLGIVSLFASFIESLMQAFF